MIVPQQWAAPRPRFIPARPRVQAPARQPRQRAPVPRAADPGQRRAVVRGQSADEPVPVASIRMPSPEALGVVSAKPRAAAEADWTTTRRRLRELGAVAFQVREIPGRGWRFVCQVRSAQPGRSRRIETGPSATEAEAIALALAEAERWAANNR